MRIHGFLPLITSLFLCSVRTFGQDLSIRRIELENEKVMLYYDLIDTVLDRVYAVNLYSSKDNFINPLKSVTGKWGLEVKPGLNNKIELNASEEFGVDFEDKVAFELRAKVYIPFIRIEGFDNNPKFKRVKPYEIQWQGGRPQSYLDFELYHGIEKISSFNNIPNGGTYNLFLTGNIKPGADYHFKISDSKNKEEVVLTKNFQIVRKFPLLFRVIPVVLLGGVVYFLVKPEPDCPGCLPDFPTTPND